jgi:chemotaxis family two-component system response regulator Rcp1
LDSQPVILVVEDNPGDVRLIREALRDMKPPVSIQVGIDADQALAYLRREAPHKDAKRPSLIFLDFNLPKAGSREFLRVIKEDRNLRSIPVAVLTTSDAERDIHEAYELHANCYLRKPVDLDSFLQIIQNAAHFWLNVACTLQNAAPERLK